MLQGKLKSDIQPGVDFQECPKCGICFEIEMVSAKQGTPPHIHNDKECDGAKKRAPVSKIAFPPGTVSCTSGRLVVG